MPEQTNPATGVQQEAPSIEQRMSAYLKQSEDHAEDEQQPADTEQSAAEEQHEGQAEPETSEEASPDTEEQEQPAVDAFEIVHNGQQVKLTREELIRHAQQGFDYTQKTQAIAQEARQVQEIKQRLAEVEQVQPYLAQQHAQVAALAAQLKQYQSVDWVQIATEDPMGYPAKRAQFDTVKEAFQGAVHQYERDRQAVKQRMDEINQQQLLSEEARLPDFIPEWRDEAKKQAGKAELAKWFQSLGVPPEALAHKLNDAFSISVAYKAMRYDQLQKTKGEKVKQLRKAPPITVPGAKSGSAKADKDIELRQKLQKTGNAQDAMAVLLNRMK